MIDQITLKLEVEEKEIEDEEIKKPCIISSYDCIKDFNKLLEEGIDSETGIYVYLVLLL